MTQAHKRLAAAAMACLTGIKTWLVDAAAHDQTENPVHMGVQEVIELNKTIGAERVILTHLPPTMDYQTLLKDLPRGFEPAYDGLSIELPASA